MAGHAPRDVKIARGIHAVNIFGAGFHSHQMTSSPRAASTSAVSAENKPAAGRPGEAGSPRHNTSIFADGPVSGAIIVQTKPGRGATGFVIINLSGGNHIDRNFYRRPRCALCRCVSAE